MLQNSRSQIERRNCLVLADGREGVQECLERVPGGEVFEEDPHGYPCAYEDGGPGQNLGIAMDDGMSLHLSTSLSATIAKTGSKSADIRGMRNEEFRIIAIRRLRSLANILFFDRKPGAKEPWTKAVWVYDLRTNRHFTLETPHFTRADLDEFVECYQPDDRHNRKATWSADNAEGRSRPYSYEAILARDKVSLDVFWLRDETLEDSANLPDPHVLAEEIAEDLRAGLEQIESVLVDLQQRAAVRSE